MGRPVRRSASGRPGRGFAEAAKVLDFPAHVQHPATLRARVRFFGERGGALSRNRDRDRKQPSRPTALDEARNELFSHIHRCGVLQASEEQQLEWMKDTIEFLSERYPSLREKELKELEGIGLRFCRPVIVNAPGAEAESAAA
jgi:hypothetical protein